MKFLKPLPTKSIRSNLEAIALYCEEQAAYDPVAPRREAFEKTAEALRKLSQGRYVTRLLDYME